MIIYPAIDLRNGKCVRLTKGDFASETIYNESPVDQAKIFEQKGFKYLHIVDLDRTIDSKKSNLEIIKSIKKNTNLKLQVGGGLRNLETVTEVLSFQVENVVIGTAAIADSNFLNAVTQKYPMKISLGLDVRNNFLALKGWTEQSKVSCFDFLKQMKHLPIKSIIFTDINKDGMKTGINLEDTLKMSQLSNIPVIASGGISNIEDIKKIKETKKIKGAIVGRAIYDGSINLDDLSKI